MRRSDETGSHIVALVVAIAVIGIVGLSGYKVWQMQQKPVATTATTMATTTTSTAPQSIKTSADLTQASHALDSSASTLNSNLDDSSLNADINSML